MKKIICALVAAVLAASFCSCSSSGSSDTLPEIAAGEKADFEVSTPKESSREIAERIRSYTVIACG